MNHPGFHFRNRLTWYLFDHQHSDLLKFITKLPRRNIPISFCRNCGGFELHAHLIRFTTIYICAECDTVYT